MDYKFVYPDRKILWPDGSEVPSELSDMLIDRIGKTRICGSSGHLDLEHGEFAWDTDNSLSMTFRIAAIKSPRKQSEVWELTFSYPAEDASAVHQDASSEEREWFTMMVGVHIDEWWYSGSYMGTARRRKPPRPPRRRR